MARKVSMHGLLVVSKILKLLWRELEVFEPKLKMKQPPRHGTNIGKKVEKWNWSVPGCASFLSPGNELTWKTGAPGHASNNQSPLRQEWVLAFSGGGPKEHPEVSSALLPGI